MRNDTLATLNDVIDTRPSQADSIGILIYRGTWRASIPQDLRKDTTLIAVFDPGLGQTKVILQVEPSAPGVGKEIGHLMLSPGGSPIALYEKLR